MNHQEETEDEIWYRELREKEGYKYFKESFGQRGSKRYDYFEETLLSGEPVMVDNGDRMGLDILTEVFEDLGYDFHDWGGDMTMDHDFSTEDTWYWITELM